MDFSQKVNLKVKKNIAAKGNKIPDVPRWNSGSISLNVELGGGFPKGRIIGITGEYSAAKTALALIATGEYMRTTDKGVLWVDAEGAWDSRWATALGVDTSKIDVVRPQFGEQAYNIILSAYEEEGFGLAVLDSVAALSSKEEVEKDMDETTVAAMARINSKFMRKIDKSQFEDEDPPTFIYINQLRENVGTYGSGLIEPGGRSLKFYPSVKLLLKAGGYTDGNKVYDYASAIEEGIEIKGQAVKFFIEKNKTASPKRRGHFWFYFDTIDEERRKGIIDKSEECIRLALKYGIIEEVSRGYFMLEGEKLHGRPAVIECIKQNKKLQEQIEKKVLNKILGEMVDGEEHTKSSSSKELVGSGESTHDNEKERVEGSETV